MITSLNSWTVACLVVGTAVLIPFIMGLFGGNQFNVKGKTILLTGASEGMGKAVAKQLSAKGANASAASPSTQRFHTISADLAVPNGALNALTEAIAWNGGNSPDVVWCIAGSSYPDFFIDTPITRLRQQMDVNFWAATEMAHGILNEWLSPAGLKKSQGQKEPKHLIFTSSVVAFYPIIGYGPYSPAKAAMRNLSDVLSQEVQLYGGGDRVKIHTVFPGGISSPGFINENLTKPQVTKVLEETDPVQTPEVVAAKAIKGLENGEFMIVVSWVGILMRACSWGWMPKNNMLLDTIVSWVSGIIGIFVRMDLDGKVRKYGKDHGHPSTYPPKEMP
ncbi:hypothetical protein HYFRA_00005274 [Hymenoscyphus fraxineus]|uniref:3-dehydrosphinganine reductase n=1 Tax=Hymenoscyphus fraxineus TaxID=746836 RepID=A0A9N9LBZ5_9HELO|nr:hypothetical protein HYFRA_00005274 [Hymenoscyphus fraxineus]